MVESETATCEPARIGLSDLVNQGTGEIAPRWDHLRPTGPDAADELQVFADRRVDMIPPGAGQKLVIVLPSVQLHPTDPGVEDEPQACAVQPGDTMESKIMNKVTRQVKWFVCIGFVLCLASCVSIRTDLPNRKGKKPKITVEPLPDFPKSEYPPGTWPSIELPSWK